MKKIISILLVSLLALALSACSESPGQSSSGTISHSLNSSTVFPASPSTPTASETLFMGSWDTIQPSHSFDDSKIKDYALALTDHIVTRALHQISDEDISDQGIFDFVVTLCQFHDNPNHPYSDIVTVYKNGGIYAQYSEPAVQRMVYELFGVNNWRYENNEHDLIRKNQYGEDEYYIAMEVGFPRSSYSYNALSITSQSDGQIVAEFNLIDSPYNNSSKKEYGLHRITFQLMDENGSSYLRFVSSLPANQ